MELPGRMKITRRMACPHCGKPLPDFCEQEILESDQYPLRCGECRQVVKIPPEVIARLKQT